MKRKNSISGGTRTHNPQIRSLVRCPLRHEDKLALLFAFIKLNTQIFATYRHSTSLSSFFFSNVRDTSLSILTLNFSQNYSSVGLKISARSVLCTLSFPKHSILIPISHPLTLDK